MFSKIFNLFFRSTSTKQYSKKDFCLLIQGPLNEISVSTIDNYLDQVDRVVISYWKQDNISILEKKIIDKSQKNKKIFLVKNDLPIIDDHIINAQNCYLQFFSTYSGLRFIDHRFCIKVRSDESYENLRNVIFLLLEDTKKFITNDLYFRRDEVYKYHISDHMIAGSSSIMKNAFYMAKLFCEKKINVNFQAFPNNPLIPEQIITYFILIALSEIYPIRYLSTNNSKELIKTYFNIVPLSDGFGQVIWSNNQAGFHGRSETDWRQVVCTTDPNIRNTTIDSLSHY